MKKFNEILPYILTPFVAFSFIYVLTRAPAGRVSELDERITGVRDLLLFKIDATYGNLKRQIEEEREKRIEGDKNLERKITYTKDVAIAIAVREAATQIGNLREYIEKSLKNYETREEATKKRNKITRYLRDLHKYLFKNEK